ncbi:hypothetical protein IWW47_006347, partial [Coemansia sp. RSA 2052]
NLAKRHRVFIMLCVCDQLATRCQEAFALPTRIRIDLAQISTWVTQTPLHIAEIRSTSIAEATAAAYADVASAAGSGSTSPSAETGAAAAAGAAGAGANAAAPAASFGGDRPFSFAMPPTHNGAAGFARPADTISPIRNHGNFAKRSIANLRGASSSSSASGAASAPGNAASTGYSRKSSTAAAASSGDFGVNQTAFGSPPAPVPRSLAFADGPNVMPLVPGPTSQGAGVIAYMRPFSRLVTDEVEKVRQEIRERERLERELRDREQAIERQKNERTKILKRQLKEQQQRRAKNEPLLKMANLMNKVSGIGARDSSIDGSSAAIIASKGVSTYG